MQIGEWWDDKCGVSLGGGEDVLAMRERRGYSTSRMSKRGIGDLRKVGPAIRAPRRPRLNAGWLARDKRH